MRMLKTVLTIVVLVLASSRVTKAENLVAGPLPATAVSDTIICSAVNSGIGSIGLGMTVVDSTGSGITLNCPSLAPLATCSITLRANRIGSGLSPFSCFMGSVPSPGSPISGTVCVHHLFVAPVPPIYTCTDAKP